MTAATAAHRDDLFTLALEWSALPRRIRVDRTGKHLFAESVTISRGHPDGGAPHYPWAIHSTAGHQRTLLVADFDDAHGTDPIADADLLCTVLGALGAPYLLTRSSVIGGVDSLRRHVLVLLDTAWSPATSAAVTRWLRAHFRSVDPTPMADSRTAAIRFPGAAHRTGGLAELAAIGLPDHGDPTSVLTGALRAPADLAARLLACTPTPTIPVRADLIAPSPARVIDDHNELAAAVGAAAHRLTTGGHGLLPARPTVHRTLPPVPAPTPDAADLVVHETVLRRWESMLDPTNLLPPIPDIAAAAQSAPPLTRARPCLPTAPETRLPVSTLTSRLAGMPVNLAAAITRPTLLPATQDASALQWRVLLSLAHRRVPAVDVIALADRYRGAAFTHSRGRRTDKNSADRIARSTTSFHHHLRHQYEKACQFVADNSTVCDKDSDDVAEVTAHINAVLTAAESDPRLGYTRAGHTRMRVLVAHLHRALAAATVTYHAGCRDLAADAGLSSPQTAATATHTLINMGYLTITSPAAGTRATCYQLTEPAKWTQGIPAPRRDAVGLLLTARSLHFRHDVWLDPKIGTAGALILFHVAHHRVCAVAELSQATGYQNGTVEVMLNRLRRLGLIDIHGNATTTTATFVAAAHATNTAGAWSRKRWQWHLESLRWQWWCAETVLLTAPRGRGPSVYRDSVLRSRGRYPRTPDGSPDHQCAILTLAWNTELVEVCQ